MYMKSLAPLETTIFSYLRQSIYFTANLCTATSREAIVGSLEDPDPTELLPVSWGKGVHEAQGLRPLYWVQNRLVK